MSDGTCSIPGEVLLYPSIKPPPPGVPVNALAATQILLDLIAELRKLHRPYPDLDGELRLCNEGCVGTTPCLTYRYADGAEARLKGVTGG